MIEQLIIIIAISSCFMCVHSASIDSRGNRVIKSNIKSNINSYSNSYSPRVQSLLETMTIADKVGQTAQMGIDLLVEPSNVREISEPFVRNALRNWRIGSVLGSPAAGGRQGAEGILSPDQLRTIVFRINEIAAEEGVPPVLYGIDSIHGGTFIDGSVLFPQQINCGASFNRTAASEIARITAKDTRACGVPWNFAPILDLSVNKLWSRVWEAFSEDPHLVTELGVAYIEGAQGNNGNNGNRDLGNPVNVAATAKHFIGYGTQNGGDKSSIRIPDRQLLEYYVPSFDASVKRANVATFMESYNEINGVPVVASKQYLDDLLRGQIGFTGLLVTDWAEIIHLVNWHKTAATTSDAVYQCFDQSTVDMSMVPWSVGDYTSALTDLVNMGFINETRIDESVARILSLKEELGLLDDPYRLPPQDVIDSIGSDEDRRIAKEIARDSIVLLKNDNNILPLDVNDANIRNILIVGPTGNSLRSQNGGWTIHHQGGNEDEFPFGYTVYTGFQQLLQSTPVSVSYQRGCAIDVDVCDAVELSDAIQAASAADVVFLCVGEDSYAEKPGDIFELDLAKGQEELARQIAATGTPVILVIIEGRPRLLNGINDLVDAVFFAALPGSEGGLAIAELSYGLTSPSAKMPITYPKHSHVPLLTYYHRNSDADSYDPQWTFGDGLSYTTFAYSNLIVPSTVTVGSNFQVSVTVQNVGSMAGSEAVLLFISDVVRTITPEVRMLKAFDKIYLLVGEERTLTFQLEQDSLAFYGIDMNRQVETGEFIVTVASLSSSFQLINSDSLYDVSNDDDEDEDDDVADVVDNHGNNNKNNNPPPTRHIISHSFLSFETLLAKYNAQTTTTTTTMFNSQNIQTVCIAIISALSGVFLTLLYQRHA